ncbi:hypothetical protein SMD11_0094 [Streptomyces albireticuli]|uniref:Uncharacterized protein n=1 Tax=Streptomyces albireticuli TaxID=1940 RepID=A0A1Z2KUY7_9ACTN|nr:hypothetical protein [Streptomyces albireticuli]ARZ65761.1 hypothetical protein SMD11_0094 [Streptomyces albireticuli]
MEAVAASVIAVLGTLLGAGITHAFQQRATARGERSARQERLRQERFDAYCSYAGALVNYRRSLIHRWHCEHEDPPPDDVAEARRRSYELRSEAQEALFRVQMLTDDEALTALAWRAFERVGKLHQIDSREELEGRRQEARELIEELVNAARQHVRARV